MIFLLIPAYALADRFAGGGAPALDDKLPGRALFWGALACAVLGYFVGGWPAVVLAVLWGLHRQLPPAMWGGSADAKSLGEIVGVAARFALLVPAIALLALLAGLDVTRAALCAAAFAVVATGLAVWYGSEVMKAVRRGEPIGDQNAAVELIRGAAFGLMCMGVLT